MRFSLKKREYVVVSVGGSLIVPEEIDTNFLSSFRSLILQKISEGFSFCIIAGGGKTCRKYQAAAKTVAEVSNETNDWIGVGINNMHADFLKALFAEHAYPKVINDFSKSFPSSHAVLCVGAEKPGHSSDYDAVVAARKLGAKKVVNLSNIDYVYTADPKKDPTATKIEKTTWTEFRNIIPKEWEPGLSSPFDPIAAKNSQELGLEVVIMNGKKLEEFENYLSGKPFVGTIIAS
jgi:uridylate kinase